MGQHSAQQLRQVGNVACSEVLLGLESFTQKQDLSPKTSVFTKGLTSRQVKMNINNSRVGGRKKVAIIIREFFNSLIR